MKESVEIMLLFLGLFSGYFVLRFGMVSRGKLRQQIQFIGGLICTTVFILIFFLLGWKYGVASIFLFWFLITSVTEVIITRIEKRINAPYKEIHEHIAKKYNITPEEVKKEIYKKLDDK